MSERETRGANEAIDFNDELRNRREKLAALRQQGVAFPNDFRRDHTSDQLHEEFDAKDNQELESLNIEVSVAGRMMTRRIMGKASFVTLQDVGGRIQLYVARDSLPEGVYNDQFKKWDLGDIIGARGTLFKTQTGELSIHCTELRLLTKALRPLPDKLAICILGLEFIHSNPRFLVGQKAASGWIFLFFTTLRKSNIGWILRRALSRVNPTLHLLPASTMSECAVHTRPCLVLLEYHCQPCGLLWSTTSLHG